MRTKHEWEGDKYVEYNPKGLDDPSENMIYRIDIDYVRKEWLYAYGVDANGVQKARAIDYEAARAMVTDDENVIVLFDDPPLRGKAQASCSISGEGTVLIELHANDGHTPSRSCQYIVDVTLTDVLCDNRIIYSNYFRDSSEARIHYDYICRKIINDEVAIVPRMELKKDGEAKK